MNVVKDVVIEVSAKEVLETDENLIFTVVGNFFKSFKGSQDEPSYSGYFDEPRIYINDIDVTETINLLYIKKNGKHVSFLCEIEEIANDKINNNI